MVLAALKWTGKSMLMMFALSFGNGVAGDCDAAGCWLLVRDRMAEMMLRVAVFQLHRAADADDVRCLAR